MFEFLTGNFQTFLMWILGSSGLDVVCHIELDWQTITADVCDGWKLGQGCQEVVVVFFRDEGWAR